MVSIYTVFLDFQRFAKVFFPDGESNPGHGGESAGS